MTGPAGRWVRAYASGIVRLSVFTAPTLTVPKLIAGAAETALGTVAATTATAAITVSRVCRRLDPAAGSRSSVAMSFSLLLDLGDHEDDVHAHGLAGSGGARAGHVEQGIEVGVRAARELCDLLVVGAQEGHRVGLVRGPADLQ